MANLAVISQVGLWCVVSMLAIVVLALVRQIGLLHRRLAPVGARTINDLPAVGSVAPPVEDVDILHGTPVGLAPLGRMSMLVFVSPDCAICSSLMPAVRGLVKSERRYLDVILVSMNPDRDANLKYLAKHGIQKVAYISSRKVIEDYHVLMPPYAVVIGADGTVQAKGLASHLDHLESLLTAARVGHPTIESYIAASSVPLAAAATETAPTGSKVGALA